LEFEDEIAGHSDPERARALSAQLLYYIAGRARALSAQCSVALVYCGAFDEIAGHSDPERARAPLLSGCTILRVEHALLVLSGFTILRVIRRDCGSFGS
jgi:hypothetical protein